MDRVDFNHYDEAFQEGKQSILDNKLVEIGPAYDERLQQLDLNFAARMQVISKSNYTYEDRKQIEAQEREQYEQRKAIIVQERDEELTASTAPDVDRLEEIIFEGERREVVLNRIEQLEAAKEKNLPHQFNKRASEKTEPGYLSRNFTAATPPLNTEREPVRDEVEQDSRISTYQKNDDVVEIDSTTDDIDFDGSDPSNDNDLGGPEI